MIPFIFNIRFRNPLHYFYPTSLYLQLIFIPYCLVLNRKDKDRGKKDRVICVCIFTSYQCSAACVLCEAHSFSGLISSSSRHWSWDTVISLLSMALSAGFVTGPLCARQQAAGASSPPFAGVGRHSVSATLALLHSPAFPCLIYQKLHRPGLSMTC